MRQDLIRHHERIWRIEKLYNQEVQKQKQLQLRSGEKHRQHEDERPWQQEEFKGFFPDAREQEIQMGQTTMGGAMGINNRSAMPPCSCACWYLSSSRTFYYDARWNLEIDPINYQMFWPHCYNGRNRNNWWNTSCIQLCRSWSWIFSKQKSLILIKLKYLVSQNP